MSWDPRRGNRPKLWEEMIEFLNSVDPMMDKLIPERLYNKDVVVSFGGRGEQRLQRRVTGCADGVLVLENGGRRH